MFSQAMMLYLYVETPLHAGSGSGLGAVDLPIQRERITDYPLVQASGLKGKLRAEAQARAQNGTINAIFGPDTDNAHSYAGALSPGDARLLLFPVRSLAGVFAWTTSAAVLARFRRDLQTCGQSVSGWDLPAIDAQDVLVAPNSDVTGGGAVVLEEFSYSPQEAEAVSQIGEWLAQQALPQGESYAYWRQRLPRALVVLPETDFRDYCLYSTDVVTRVSIDNETKTASGKALWTEESLPAETLLYSPLMATDARKPDSDLSAHGVLSYVRDLELSRMQLGGNETVGRGLVALRFGEVLDAGTK